MTLLIVEYVSMVYMYALYGFIENTYGSFTHVSVFMLQTTVLYFDHLLDPFYVLV